MSPITLLLAGLVLSFYCAAVNQLLVLFHHEQLQNLFLWSSGMLNQQDWSLVVFLFPRLLLLLASVLTAMATLTVGPLSFVGLMAPHLARMMGFSRVIPQLCCSALIGGILMLLADWAGRMILFPNQVPAGLLATFIGAPYFIYLLRKQVH
ncbi:MAG: iron chelate uptake ABC transporter family permease subunit [Symbiopectobacterium sp.]|uniref:iron chelate uptake ABC transporter family permease subunit n=1 Tax=Symbiopectobacterium sp. TaxID=2952789 RepID=UPI0039EBF915